MFQAPIKFEPQHGGEVSHVPPGDVGAIPLQVTANASEFELARAEVLWRTMPAFAGIVLLCTLLGGWALRHAVAPTLLLGWGVLQLAGLALIARGRRAAAQRRTAPPEWWTVAQTTALAATWLSLPGTAFGTLPVDGQVSVAGLTCLMMASGVLLVIVPPAAAWWSGALGVALAGLLVLDRGAAMLPYATLVLAYLVALFTGAAHAARLAADHIGLTAELRRRCETIGSLLREYEEHGTGWLWQTDANNQLTYVSPGLSRIMGMPKGDLAGRSLPVLLGGDARLGGALVAREPFSALEFQIKTAAGPRWIALSGNPIIHGEGMFSGYRGTGSDVTEWRNSQVRLTRLASSDVLTGLPNRQRVRELMDAALAEAKQTSGLCAVMFLDLDDFKPVNDKLGHAKGDAVLRIVAQRLAREVGDAGEVGRIGGDEFAIVVPRAESRKVMESLGRRLIAAVAEPCLVDGAAIKVGVSIGCAFGPLDAEKVDDLVQRADLALYLAKDEGRGTMRHFDAAMQSKAEERARLESELRSAIQHNQFELHYQPIVNAETRIIVGFEALIRWRHPERGLVSPALFVPLAEEIGLIPAIGEWVLRTACRDAASWPDSVSVAVNVSPKQLLQPSLPTVVSDALTSARLPANRLELEVTESVFMDDSQGALDVLRRVRSLGVGIALDDFGTGYSSLGYLNKTIFHKLKIDGSFVRDAGQRTETVSIIRAIVELARSFRMTIVAEGVEKVEDFNRMRELGCHQIQGYLFGKPVPYEKALELVGTRWDRRAS